MNTCDLFARIKVEAQKIDAAMRDDLATAADPMLVEVLQHGIFNGGKRVRPLLTILAARLAGPLPADRERDLYRLALALEYLHAASLLHDDVIDHAATRRGHKTANAIWGNTPTILAGDYLHARAMHLAGSLGGLECLGVIAGATTAMVEAEFLQLATARDHNPSETNYFAVLAGKTGALIAAACEAGIIYAGGTAEQRRALRTYGENLGLAFQLVDDLLDYLGDPDKTGKAVGNDFQEAKMTLPLIHAMTAAGAAERDFLTVLLNGEAAERSSQLGAVRDLIESHAGFTYTRSRARDLIDVALADLEIFPDSPAKEILTGLSRYVLSREK